MAIIKGSENLYNKIILDAGALLVMFLLTDNRMLYTSYYPDKMFFRKCVSYISIVSG